METKPKCSLKKHEELEAIIYCQECKMNMCNKCEILHTELFENSHHQYKLDKNINEIFTGLCKEKGHLNKLEYFCKTHNHLCCVECIARIKYKGNGQHKDCNICTIEDIKEEKKNKLKSNIKCLEELSNLLEESIEQLKIIYEKINENKEQLKNKIQKVFTKIRNQLNDREDELLSLVDNKYDSIFFKEDIFKKNEKLPNKIKLSLKNTNIVDNDWNDESKLSSLINYCTNIENNINEVNIINEKIKQSKSNKIDKIQFFPEKDNEINNFLESIKTFGKICYNKNIYKFKKCPNNINSNRKYTVSGENENILTKTGDNDWMGTICENELEKNEEHIWKIKILRTYNYNIMIGVAPNEFEINSSIYDNYGWYYYCYNSKFRSGPPHNYDKKTSLPNKKDEVIVIMNLNKRTLTFKIEDKTESYTDIPIDKPLVPAIFLYHKNDSIEITEC